MNEIQSAYKKVLEDMFVYCIGKKLLQAEHAYKDRAGYCSKIVYEGKIPDQQWDAFERALKNKIDESVSLESRPDIADNILIVHLPVDANGDLKPYVEKPISNTMAAFDLWGGHTTSSQTST